LIIGICQTSEPASANISAAATEPQASLINLLTAAATRPVFPFSIVPGGVRDAHELQSAAAVDPVVAKHYADFRIHWPTKSDSLTHNRCSSPIAATTAYSGPKNPC